MPVFITRVELRDAAPSDYETLATAMISQGFLLTITGDDGIAYHLPNGNYLGQTEGSAAEVMNIAGFAASITGKAFAILTTEFERTSWRGLIPVEAPAAASE